MLAPLYMPARAFAALAELVPERERADLGENLAVWSSSSASSLASTRDDLFDPELNFAICVGSQLTSDVKGCAPNLNKY